MRHEKRKRRKAPGTARESVAELRATRKVSPTEASRNFSELLNRVRYRGESFIVERGGEPICEIRPAAPARFTGADLISLLSSLPSVEEDYLSDVEELVQAQPLMPESPWEH